MSAVMASAYGILFMPLVKGKLPGFFVRKYEEQNGACDDEAYNKLTVDHLLDSYQVSVEAQEVVESQLSYEKTPLSDGIPAGMEVPADDQDDDLQATLDFFNEWEEDDHDFNNNA